MRMRLRLLVVGLVMAITAMITAAVPTPASAQATNCDALFETLERVLDAEDAAFELPEGRRRDAVLARLELQEAQLSLQLEEGGCFDEDDNGGGEPPPAPPGPEQLHEIANQISDFLGAIIRFDQSPPATFRDAFDFAACAFNAIVKYTRGPVPPLSELCQRLIEGRITERCAELFTVERDRRLCEYVFEQATQ